MFPRSSRLPIALVAVVCLVHPLPAAGAPAPLPDWGAAGKPGSKPAEKPAESSKQTASLPDWGAAGKPKSDKPKAKPKKPKSKSTEPGETTPQTEPGEPTPDETTPEPAAAEPTPAEPTAAEPVAATPEGPASEPAEPAADKPGTDTGGGEGLRRRGRAELITGAVFMVGGLAGVGVLGAGAFIKGRADSELDDAEGRTDVDLDPLYSQQKQGETMLAAGAVVGVIGMALGIALVAAGARDMKAGRAGRTSRVRVAPTFGGLVISGRF